MGNQLSFIERRSARYGTNMALMILIVLGIVAVVALLSANHNWRLDATQNKRYSLAPQTVKLLRELKEPVKAYAFYQEADPSRAAAEDLLNLYKYQSNGQLSFEFIDPDRFPMRAQQYKVTSYNSIVLERGERSEKAFMAEEEKITNALLKLTRGEKRIIYMLQGHGEHAIDNIQKDGFSDAKKAMEGENYEVKPLLMAREQAVPADATAVVLAGPQKALQDEELKALREYVEAGGKLLILADPQGAPGLDGFLKPFGVLLGQDMIVDRASRLLGGDYLVPPIVQYEAHPITQDFRQSSYLVYLPMARSVRPLEPPAEDVSVEVLARTGPGSWGETDLERLRRGEAELGADDVQGPVPVAAVVTPKAKDGKKGGRMVVIGDSDFATNAAMDPSRSANQDFFLNTVNWLADQEDLLSIRPKSAPSRPAFLSLHQQLVIFVLVVVALPVAVLAMGLGVLWRRRKMK
jgi:ABC-type uncharacterized transport system involved in gliding motility auxiliary subunit